MIRWQIKKEKQAAAGRQLPGALLTGPERGPAGLPGKPRLPEAAAEAEIEKQEIKKYGLIIFGTVFIAFAVCKSGDGLV